MRLMFEERFVCTFYSQNINTCYDRPDCGDAAPAAAVAGPEPGGDVTGAEVG